MIVRFAEVLLLTASITADDVSHSHRVVGEPSNCVANTDGNRSRRILSASVKTMCHLADFNFFTYTTACPMSHGVASAYGLIVKKV